jgi:ubiquitin carboxyl-terminal hydrolase 5/13
LNLTDGSILCGKWFFDSSGGNGHALEHYRDMGYPLAVKLGTITPDGAGEWTFAEFRNVQWIRRIAVASYMDYQL